MIMCKNYKIYYLDDKKFLFAMKKDYSKEEMIATFQLSKKTQKLFHFPNKESYKKDEKICISFPGETIPNPSFTPIEVVYEDEMILAVNKPPFLLVHEDGNTQDTLQNRVNGYLLQKNWTHPAQALHRIDYETSGLVLFSKNRFFQPLFDACIASHAFYKQYLCIVKGKFPYKEKTCTFPIARNRHQANAMIVHKNGKEAYTHIERLETKQDSSLLKVEIQTGRKHQIRVHCAYLGYPIINDSIYGGIQNGKGLYLQNQTMEFMHPVYGKQMNIHLEMDPRFKAAGYTKCDSHKITK